MPLDPPAPDRPATDAAGGPPADRARPAPAPSSLSPLDVVTGGILDVLVLFLRTIPLYPDGHGRVVAVTEKFQGALAERGSATVVEPTEGGLRVDGEDHLSLTAGATAFRESLLRTGVSRVVFHADAPHASYVVFARSLQRNARLAQSGALTFADLWMAPIEGIEVEEQTFHADDFCGGGEASGGGGRSANARIGGGASRSAGSGDEDAGDARPEAGPEGVHGGQGTDLGDVARTTSPSASEPIAKAAPRPARSLRKAVLDDPEARALVDEVRRKLAARGEVVEGSTSRGRDVLDHVLASLPIEARLDLRRGAAVVRSVLLRLSAGLASQGEAGVSSTALSATLVRAMEGVFPDRVGELRAEPVPASPAPTAVASAVDPVEAEAEETAAVDDVAWATSGYFVDLPTAAIDVADGLDDEAGVLAHAALELPPGPRLDAVSGRLASVLKTRPSLARPPCVVDHLKQLLESPTRDAARIRALASALDRSGVDVARVFGSGLDPDMVVAAFPSLVVPFVASGGSVGYLARALGRSAVVAAAPELAAEGGLLGRDDLVLRILSERTRDALPFVEVMLPARDPSRRRAILASLRRSDLPSAAAVTLRVAPESAIPDSLLHVLCRDGFEGADSHAGDEEAVGVIGAVAEGTLAGVDGVARAYAASTLCAFDRGLAEPIVHRLLKRKLLVGGAPKEVRSAAALVLEKWGRGEGRASSAASRGGEERT